MAERLREELDWWLRWPSLLEAEMAAFSAKGAVANIVSDTNGCLMLGVEWPMGDRTVMLQVGYSPLHPHFRPTVSTNDLAFTRHQNPFDGGLCLLVQGSGQWHAAEPLANLIDAQLAKIVAVNELRADSKWEQAGQLEEHAADPLSAYFSGLSEDNSAIFMPSNPAIPKTGGGSAKFIGLWRSQQGPEGPFEAILRKCEPLAGNWLASAFDLPQRIGDWNNIPGRWVRLAGPVPKDPGEILKAADAEFSRLAVMDKSFRPIAVMPDADLSITAVVFDDELEYGAGGRGDGLLFLAVRRDRRKAGKRTVSLVRGFRVGDDLNSRLPVAASIRSKKILFLGCGAIGSFAAIELARAGIGAIRIVDHDTLEPGNSVRWPLGRPSWGLSKVAALHAFVVHNYPWTKTTGVRLRIGGAISDPNEIANIEGNPRELLRGWISDADLVIDATASDECQLAVASLCRDLHKPLVIGYATEGAVGGIVVRLRPDSDGCLVCLHEHWNAGSVPLPPIDPAGSVVPLGCNAPTFTGGAFDLEEVSLEIVRSAIGLLAPEVRDLGDWEWSSLALTKDGRRCLPQWSCGMIERHHRCQCGNA